MNSKLTKYIVPILMIIMCMNITAFADDDSEPVNIEQSSFIEYEGEQIEIDDYNQYVDGIYNVGINARAAMTGVIRLYQSDTKIVCAYSTAYTYSVDRIGVKNIKLQYKGSLGLWHDIITLSDRYDTNVAGFQGAFSCTGVLGRTYRVKGTHYIVDGSYTEERNNVTEGLTFR